MAIRQLTPDVLAGIAAKKKDLVKFPTRNVEVNVRELTAAEITRVQQSIIGCDESDPGANKATEVLVCSLGITDGDYDSDAGRESLAGLPDGMRRKISNAILGLSGLDAIAAKN